MFLKIFKQFKENETVQNNKIKAKRDTKTEIKQFRAILIACTTMCIGFEAHNLPSIGFT